PGGGAPSDDARFPLQALQRLGSFLNCLSWKKSCSPAVKTNSAPQSMHLRFLSWNSMERRPSPFPATPPGILHGRPATLGMTSTLTPKDSHSDCRRAGCV